MTTETVPAAFRKRFAEHNRQAVYAALFALILAFLAWLLLYGLFYWAIIFLGTVKNGDQMMPPHWIGPLFFAFATLLFVLAALDYTLSRFKPQEDKPIIGIHLVKDFLLALPRLTFSVFGNLLACRILSRNDLLGAWALLRKIYTDGKSNAFALSQIEPDSRRLNALLFALQIADFIDLHRGEEFWFYTVRSDQIRLIHDMIKLEKEACPEKLDA